MRCKMIFTVTAVLVILALATVAVRAVLARPPSPERELWDMTPTAASAPWYDVCPVMPPTPTSWPARPTYTPQPTPSCLPTPTQRPNPSPTFYPTATVYPAQPTFGAPAGATATATGEYSPLPTPTTTGMYSPLPIP